MNFNFVTYKATGNIIGVAYYPEFFDMSVFLKYRAWPLNLRTESGVLAIEKTGNRSYRVRMGSVVSDIGSLRRYVNTLYFPVYSTLTDVPIPANLLRKINTLPFGPAGPLCSVGFSTAEAHTN